MRLKRGQESKSSDVIDFLKEGKERRDVFESYSSISRKEETIGKRALGRARSRRLSPVRIHGNNVGKAIACIVWPRNERLLMTLQIKRMRLKRGQETPFHRLLWEGHCLHRLAKKRAPLDDITNQKNATQKGSRNSIPSSTLGRPLPASFGQETSAS
ncbi:hypothetical protein OIU85_007467 [Salix viminalis]|uniref:Uncharacterized protein n=1 Tax=Salix viminalis TaxID=40686 RepID=A0A9Q0P9M1_SALVM|nr:hypothetical protein OIU85_007467 [Salix viminalis]